MLSADAVHLNWRVSDKLLCVSLTPGLTSSMYSRVLQRTYHYIHSQRNATHASNQLTQRTQRMHCVSKQPNLW